LSASQRGSIFLKIRSSGGVGASDGAGGGNNRSNGGLVDGRGCA